MQIISYLKRSIKTFKRSLETIPNLLINYIFGNTSGLRSNLLKDQMLFLKRYLFKAKYPEVNVMHAQNHRHVSDLCDDGYVILNDLIEDSILDESVQIVRKCFDQDRVYYKSHNGLTFFIINPVQYPAFRRLLSSQIREIILGYYKCAFKIKTIRVWRNHSVSLTSDDTVDVYSNTFHNDNCPLYGLRVFIYLCDGVNSSTGAFRFHDKRSTTSLVRSFTFFHRFQQSKKSIAKLTSGNSLQFFSGDIGSVAIVNTQQCLHAASVPKANSYRDIIQFEIYPDFGACKKDSTLFSIGSDFDLTSQVIVP